MTHTRARVALATALTALWIAGVTLNSQQAASRRAAAAMTTAAEKFLGGLTAEQASITEPALRSIVRDYTREAGVRTLERTIGAVLRHVAVRVADGTIDRETVDVDAIATVLGAPSCLINNAARFERDTLATLDGATWQAHLDVNVRAPVFLTQAFATALPDGTEGNVINILDQKVLRLTPDYFSYTIAKAALWTATQTMAQALAPKIRVNAIAPGPVLKHEGQSKSAFERATRLC